MKAQIVIIGVMVFTIFSYGYSAMKSIPSVDFDKSISERIMKDCDTIIEKKRTSRMLAYAL